MGTPGTGPGGGDLSGSEAAEERSRALGKHRGALPSWPRVSARGSLVSVATPGHCLASAGSRVTSTWSRQGLEPGAALTLTAPAWQPERLLSEDQVDAHAGLSLLATRTASSSGDFIGSFLEGTALEGGDTLGKGKVTECRVAQALESWKVLGREGAQPCRGSASGHQGEGRREEDPVSPACCHPGGPGQRGRYQKPGWKGPGVHACPGEAGTQPGEVASASLTPAQAQPHPPQPPLLSAEGGRPQPCSAG